MNRREAIIAGVAGITAAVAVAPTADAQASQAANPELLSIPISTSEGCTRLWKPEIQFDGIFEGLGVQPPAAAPHLKVG
jgi:hypothetical protein